MKKIVCSSDEVNEIESEIEIQKQLSSSQYQVKLYDVAKLPQGQDEFKYYLFMEFAGKKTGSVAISELNYLPSKRLVKLQTRLLARHYILAVAELHDHHKFHLDIKPENFLHESTHIRKLKTKLGDFGLASSDPAFFQVLGTAGFFPPEIAQYRWKALKSMRVFGKNIYLEELPTNYDNQKRDAWSLGMLLLWLKYKGRMDQVYSNSVLEVTRKQPNSNNIYKERIPLAIL